MNFANSMFRSMSKVAIFLGFLILSLLGGCSSAPDPPPEPSKQEIRQDSDRFFNKMSKEESQRSSDP